MIKLSEVAITAATLLLLPVVQVSAIEIVVTSWGSLSTEQQEMTQQAIDDWEALLPSGFSHTVDIEFDFVALQAGLVGQTDNRSYDTDYRPTGARIRLKNSGIPWHVGPEMPQQGDADWLTAVRHEIAHALGFTNECQRFSRNISAGPGSYRTYNAGGTPSATLVEEGEPHLDETVHPDSLMNRELVAGQRVEISELEADLLKHDVFAFDILQNGSFEYGTNPPTGSYTLLKAVNGAIDHWTVSSGQIDWVNLHWEASDGTLSVDLCGLVAGRIEQSFPTSIGQQYKVTFDMAGNYVRCGIKQLRVEAAGQSADFSFDSCGHSSTDMGWTTNTWVFEATDTTTTLSFRSLADYRSYGPALDNVSVNVAGGGGCAPAAAASTIGTSQVYGPSELGKHLAYFLLPLGVVIGLGIWRRKK